MSNKFIVITGGLAQGKTMYMSYLAHEIAQKDEDVYGNIYSNYELKDSKRIVPGQPLKNAIIAIDEADRTLYRGQLLEEECNKVYENCIIIVATHHISMIKGVPAKAEHIEVKKDGELITLESGDYIYIDEFKDLYGIDATGMLTGVFLQPEPAQVDLIGFALGETLMKIIDIENSLDTGNEREKELFIILSEASYGVSKAIQLVDKMRNE